MAPKTSRLRPAAAARGPYPRTAMERVEHPRWLNLSVFTLGAPTHFTLGRLRAQLARGCGPRSIWRRIGSHARFINKAYAPRPWIRTRGVLHHVEITREERLPWCEILSRPGEECGFARRPNASGGRTSLSPIRLAPGPGSPCAAVGGAKVAQGDYPILPHLVRFAHSPREAPRRCARG